MRKHIFLTGFLILLVLAGQTTVYEAAPANAQADKRAIENIWSDGFEDGQPLDDKYEDVGSTGLSVTADDAFSGGHALQQHYEPGQVDAGWVCKVNNAGFPDHLFVRWYHKFEDSFTSFPPKMARVRYRNRTTWTTSFAVHFWIESNGEAVADVYARNSSQANSTGWLPIARSGFFFDDPANAGRWIRFEMEVKLNTPGQADGLYRFWADDTLIVERTGVDLRGSTQEKINEVMLDTYWNGGSPIAQNRYYDDFAIATGRIGAGQPAQVSDLRLSEAVHAGGVLTGTLLWSAPAEAITYTLGYATSPITEANWDSATRRTLPFPAAPAGSTEAYTVNIPYTAGKIYFALKAQNATGNWSLLSNNAFWPRQDFYLPLVLR
ncbi:MAG: polysaccharide lyase [Chloroflexota bacterium]